MRDTTLFRGDLAYCRRVLAGYEDAARELREVYYPRIHAALLARCGDSRSRAEVEEIADAVLVDCFGREGKRPLLALYSGRAPLTNWLVSVAINRLKNWWSSGRWRYEMSEREPEGSLRVRADVGGCAGGEGSMEVAEYLLEAMEAAFREISPRDLLFLRLVYLKEMPRNQVAARWGCDPATVGRRVNRALDELRALTLEHLRSFDEHIDVTWEDCETMCRQWPSRLNAGTSGGATQSNGGLEA